MQQPRYTRLSFLRTSPDSSFTRTDGLAIKLPDNNLCSNGRRTYPRVEFLPALLVSRRQRDLPLLLLINKNIVYIQKCSLPNIYDLPEFECDTQYPWEAGRACPAFIIMRSWYILYNMLWVDVNPQVLSQSLTQGHSLLCWYTLR